MLTGPVGGGKSTLASALARALRQRGAAGPQSTASANSASAADQGSERYSTESGSSEQASAADQGSERYNGPVALIDLDLVYCMLRQTEGFEEPGIWSLARRGAGALAATALEHGFRWAVVEGEFFSEQHLEDLHAGGGGRLPRARVFALEVPYEEVWRRVRGDPSRGASKNPEFLAQLHSSFVAVVPQLQRLGTVLQAGDRDATTLAAWVMERLQAG